MGCSLKGWQDAEAPPGRTTGSTGPRLPSPFSGSRFSVLGAEPSCWLLVPWSPSREGWVASWPGGQAVLVPSSEDILESYENPPPIVLPSEGFQVDLEADCLDDSIYQHLLYLRHFLWGLRSQPSPRGGTPQPQGPEVPLSCWSVAPAWTVGWTQGSRPGEEARGTAGGPLPP